MPHLFSRTRALLGVTSFAVLTAATLLGAPTLAQAATSSKLEPGQYVENLGMRRYSEPFVLQQLTDRTYMVFVSTHSATVYVGDQGVLVFDPLSNGYGQGVLDAINSITDLPVTGLVYSHYHLDHLSDAQLFCRCRNSQGDRAPDHLLGSRCEPGRKLRDCNPSPHRCGRKRSGLLHL